jgi:hypothetical protein
LFAIRGAAWTLVLTSSNLRAAPIVRSVFTVDPLCVLVVFSLHSLAVLLTLAPVTRTETGAMAQSRESFYTKSPHQAALTAVLVIELL